MAINFFSEDISFALEDKVKTIGWINKILLIEGCISKNINYIFCSDNHLLSINKQYLNHDSFTDIITFDHSEQKIELEADIFISIERIKENSSTLNKNFDDELHRVIIHGLLHLFGLKDKTEGEKKVMREKEDACLSLR